MYDNLIWLLLIMTPGVLSMTYFIWRTESRVAPPLVSSKEKYQR